MDNFRRFLRGTLDGLTDETADVGRQLKRHAKAGTAAHFVVELALGLQGEVTEDAESGFDFRVRTTTGLPLGGGAVEPEVGYSTGTTGRFLGPGQAQLTCRLVLVNATALEAGVDPTDPQG
jgi:hypothetical protein